MPFRYENINIVQRLDPLVGGKVVTTGKAQLVTDDGTTTVPQAAPLSDGQILISDAGETTGMAWNTPTLANLGIIAGTGLSETGNTINANGSATILANADNLEVNSSNTANQVLLSSGTAGTAATYGSLPLNDSNAVTGILPFANGGTGASSFSSGSSLVATNPGNTALVSTGINPADLGPTTATLTTVNNTPQTILTVPTTTDTLYYIKAIFLARQANDGSIVASLKVLASVNNNGGTLTLVDNANDLVYVYNTGASITWTANISVSGTDIIFQVTGDPSNDVDWKVSVEPFVTM